MPWVKHCKDDPAYYCVPHAEDDMILGRALSVLYSKRKELGQLREYLLSIQKEIGKNDRENAKYLSEVCKDLLKEFRGFDLAILWIETSDKSRISEEIAPYVDQAFKYNG